MHSINSSRLPKISIFTPLKCFANAGITVCSAVIVKICPAVFVHLLAISLLCQLLRTYQNLRGNTGCDRVFVYTFCSTFDCYIIGICF